VDLHHFDNLDPHPDLHPREKIPIPHISDKLDPEPDPDPH
jgi:hypothetical protein